MRHKKPRKSKGRPANLVDGPHLPIMGRPTRLTKEAKDKICRALRLGLPMESAAALAGVRSETIYGWIRRGKAAKAGGYSHFVRAVEEALTEFEARNAAIINQMAQGTEAATPDWKAAMTLLERRRPQTWAKTEKHEVTGQGGGPVRYEIIREEGADWREAIEVKAEVVEVPTNGNGNGDTP